MRAPNSSLPELPNRKDFYYRDKSGKEISHELRPLIRNFLKEAWAKNFLFEDKKRINYALRLARESHTGQIRRERNLPYLAHPVEAALGALRDGCSASFLIWLLLHDTREDTWIRFKNKNFVRELFRGTITEVITRKLSRFRLQKDSATGETESVKISDEDYSLQLRGSHSAVKAKHYDTLSNLKSDGRRLDLCFELPSDEAQEIVTDIKKFLEKVRNFLLPIEADFYSELKKESEEIILKLKKRLQIVEAFIAKSVSQPSARPVSMRHDE